MAIWVLQGLQAKRERPELLEARVLRAPQYSFSPMTERTAIWVRQVRLDNFGCIRCYRHHRFYWRSRPCRPWIVLPLQDDGQDGDLGPPGSSGPPGATGIKGIAGPAIYVFDETTDDNGMIGYHNFSAVIPNSPLFAQGYTIGANVGGLSSSFAYSIGANPLNSVTAGGFIQLYGSLSNNEVVLGAGGNQVLQVFSTATVCFGAFIVLTATPPAVAGQTAIGTTTTATVITTAGGIALPALASTFWVVNVNGVRYGVPCFAL